MTDEEIDQRSSRPDENAGMLAENGKYEEKRPPQESGPGTGSDG